MHTWTTTYTLKPVLTTPGGYHNVQAIEAMPDEEAYQAVMSVVTTLSGVPQYAVLGKSRIQKTVYARHTIRYILSEMMEWGPVRTATAMDCDHTTVLHSCKVIRDEMGNNKRLASLVHGVINALMIRVPR